MSTLLTTGQRDDVQAKIDQAAPNDVIQFPAGIFNINADINCAKGIHLKGAYGGDVLARSRSVIAVGTGRKSFVLGSAQRANNFNTRKAKLVPDTVVRIWREGGEIDLAKYGGGGPPFGIGGNLPWMEGKVVSLEADVLTVDVTTTNYTGTHHCWVVTSMPGTTLNMTATLRVSLVDTARFELSGLALVGGATNVHLCTVAGSRNGPPPLFHDFWLNPQIQGSNGIRFLVNRGLIQRCASPSLPASRGSTSAIYVKCQGDDSWTTKSTMGKADTTGRRNVYIEDSYVSFYIDGIENDDNARVVIRNSVISNCGIGAHGRDTSYEGMRHVEMYDNDFLYDAVRNGSYNLQGYFVPRGGTGVFTGNFLEKVESSGDADWGKRPEIMLQVQPLNRQGTFEYPWTSGWPVPRQVGLGYVTGAGRDGKGRTHTPDGLYVGDPEPMYIWDNYGFAPQILGDGWGVYVVDGQTFIRGPKPGWERFPYPHPEGVGGIVSPPPPPPPDPQPIPAPSPLPAGVSPLATVANLGALRNDYAGWVGMQLTTGASPITVSHLGRLMVSGNSQSHTVKLVKAPATDVASVSIPMGGGVPGQMKYAALASPIPVEPNTQYFLLSQETVGGDQWYDHRGTVLNAPSVGTLPAVVWGTGEPWNVQAVGANEGYGPLGLGYSATVTPPPPPPDPVPPPPTGTAPTISIIPASHIAKKKSNVTFTATVTGTEPLTFQWAKDGALLVGKNSHTLELRQVTPGSSGIYSCTVTNGIGNPAVAKATLVVR